MTINNALGRRNFPVVTAAAPRGFALHFSFPFTPGVAAERK